MGNVSLRIAASPFLALLVTVAVATASYAVSGMVLIPALLSLLLGCAVYLSQAAQSRMRQLQAVNVLLESEIARRKRFEQELQEKQLYTRSLIESSIDALAIIDTSGVITDVNRQMVMLAGLPREELIGTRFSGYFRDPQCAEEAVRLALQTGRVSHYELVARASDGRDTVVACNASIFRNPKGNLRGIVVSARDITDQKQAEERLVEHAALQLAMAELGQKALAVFDLQRLLDEAVSRLATVLRVEYCKILELQSGERDLLLRAGVGWKPGLVGRARVGTRTDSQAGFTLASEEPVVVEDLRLETRFSGPALLFEHGVVSGISVVIRAAGRTFGVLGAHTTSPRRFTADEVNFLQAVANLLGLAIARQQLEEQLLRFTTELQRSNSELQDFASIASHDLQEPLRKITSFGERLRSCCAAHLDETGRDYLMRMESAARRMSLLLENLLRYSRVSTKAQPFEAVDLQAIMLEVISDLEARLQESQASVEVLPLPIIEADRLQIKALLQNLVGNAAKFHAPGVPPRIRVSAGLDNGFCELHVSDNGIGFEAKHAESIFRPFHRLHSRSEFEGTGMGLAICRKIVSRHGGTITARSELGRGSEFIVRLPTRPQPEGSTWVPADDQLPLSSLPKTMTTTTS